jgi:hypothetical protein
MTDESSQGGTEGLNNNQKLTRKKFIQFRRPDGKITMVDSLSTFAEIRVPKNIEEGQKYDIIYNNDEKYPYNCFDCVVTKVEPEKMEGGGRKYRSRKMTKRKMTKRKMKGKKKNRKSRRK